MGELINNAKDDPNFKEFFKAQREYKTLNDKIVTNPKTGEKIRFGNLMKEVYGSSVVPYNIDHVKSIIDEPFTSLRVLPARINKAAGNIIQMDEKFITNPELKGKYTKQGKEAQLKKIGYNFNQSIDSLIETELKLADDVLNKGRNLRKPNEIVESIRKGENYVPDFYSKTAKPGEGFGKQLIEGQRLKPPSGSGAVTLGALDVPSMFKRLSPLGRKVVGTTGGLIIPEKIFYELDKANIMSKGVSEKEAEQQALKNLSLNLVGNNKEYLKKLKETAESMGIDGSTFDSVYELNVLNKSYQQNSKNVDAQMITALENKDLKTSEELRKNFNKYLERIKPEFERLQNDIVGRISGGSPLQMSKAKDTVTEEQFQKPFYDMQDVAMEKLKREKQSVFPKIQTKYNPAEGSMGTGFLNVFDSLTQGAKNLIQGRVVPYASKIGLPQYEPKASERQITTQELKNMDSRELQRYNLGRGFTYDNPVRPGDIETLQYENPGVFFAGGGIAKMAGDSSGPPPVRGPNPQGLLSLKNRVRNY